MVRSPGLPSAVPSQPSMGWIAMELPTSMPATRTGRARMARTRAGSGSKRTCSAPMALELCRSSSRFLYVKWRIEVAVARKDRYSGGAEDGDGDGRAQRNRVGAEVLAQK